MSNFIGDHRKSTTLLTRSGGFDGRVQSQQVGLIGNPVNGLDDGGDLLRTLSELGDDDRRILDISGDFPHFARSLLDNHRAMFGSLACLD